MVHHLKSDPCRGTTVGLGGLEPPTSRLSGARSSQLSYRPGSLAPERSTYQQEKSKNEPWLGLSKPDSKSLVTTAGLSPSETAIDLKSTTPRLPSVGWAVPAPKRRPHPRVSLERR